MFVLYSITIILWHVLYHCTIQDTQNANKIHSILTRNYSKTVKMLHWSRMKKPPIANNLPHTVLTFPTFGTCLGRNVSWWTDPDGNRLLATTWSNVWGFRSDARPIRRYSDPGWMTTIVCAWICCKGYRQNKHEFKICNSTVYKRHNL